eukprot:m.44506 g.44506  ORF g.44506 m.44506 type:complete len:623 (-) comp7177_c0_seq1:915-2783(-)
MDNNNSGDMNVPLLERRDGRFEEERETVTTRNRKTNTAKPYFAKDPDEFFSNLYSYFTGKGALNIFLSAIFELLNLLFLFLFFLFLILCVDYHALTVVMNASGEECPDGSISNPSLFHPDCHGNQPIHFERFRQPNAVVVFFAIFFSVAYVIVLVSKIKEVFTGLKMNIVFSKHLQITSSQLNHMEWREVAAKFIEAYDNKQITFPGQLGQMTPLVVKAMILRQKNGLLGLYRYHLSIRSPFSWGWENFTKCMTCCFCSGNDESDVKNFVEYLPQTLHVILLYILKKKVFVKDSDGNRIIQRRLREGGTSTVRDQLRVSFILSGLFVLCIFPLLMLYYFISFAISFADVIKSSPGNLALRQWSHSAAYKFRLHNELDHYMEERLQRAYAPTKEYIDSFVSKTTVLVARFLMFIAGAIVLACFIGSQYYDDKFLLLTFFGDRSVLWTSSNLVLIMGICRSLASGTKSGLSHSELWKKSAKELVIFDDEWEKHPSHPSTPAAISNFFNATIKKHFQELFAFVTVPFILLFVLPPQAETIAKFYHNRFIEVEGLGYHEILVGNAIRKERGLDAVLVNRRDDDGVDVMYHSTVDGQSHTAVPMGENEDDDLEKDFLKSVMHEREYY